ncbi:MAG: hypothetical protein A2X25_01345 [Chloroflexi bacterium GWB2_49_20]|nr:MAG: hypothetical protein A2X25_01345 [Chloroflexi bacterium GWB2_49_20]OGN76868.1 MAG: hypothetical protein A2X26_09130 [Chloroflexi bacterium GWC2_49_37]OGN84388.1 MAG: hypothetical protein A2X27_03145 [Chloroflexi bacterium GWD2_49_16]HCM96742.1 hypothetical protein [Anaerolineae bacterium]
MRISGFIKKTCLDDLLLQIFTSNLMKNPLEGRGLFVRTLARPKGHRDDVAWKFQGKKFSQCDKPENLRYFNFFNMPGDTPTSCFF